MRQSDADTGRRQKWTESISARVKSGVQPRAVARRLNVVTPVLIPLIPIILLLVLSLPFALAREDATQVPRVVPLAGAPFFLLLLLLSFLPGGGVGIMQARIRLQLLTEVLSDPGMCYAFVVYLIECVKKPGTSLSLSLSLSTATATAADIRLSKKVHL